MERFANQPLRSRPHLAVFSSTKVGNFVVTTPLLRGLKEKYPDCTLDFFGSDITCDFETHSPYIDSRFSLYTKRPDFLEALTTTVRDRIETAGPYDLAINCDEFSELNLVAVTAIRPQYLAGGGLSLDFRRKFDVGEAPTQRMLQDDDWDSPDFLRRYRGIITSNYIAELFCRMAYVETDFFKLELPVQPPPFNTPDILIHVTTTRSAKMWPVHYWREIIDWCDSQGLSVGLVGSPPKVQQALYHSGNNEDALIAETALIDLRGQTSLIELAGAFKQARACISVDAGPLHIAAAVNCPTIALFGNDPDGFGASPSRLWAPRSPHVHRVPSSFTCKVCAENRFKNEACLVDDHPCMTYLSPESVVDRLQAIVALAVV
ncbi:MAG: glycosyltransferase family 9 protein [Cyanobacteria bacterium P01_D01_bin.123]